MPGYLGNDGFHADAADGRGGALAELQLGDSARFFPSDAALAGWRAQADQGKSAIVYD